MRNKFPQCRWLSRSQIFANFQKGLHIVLIGFIALSCDNYFGEKTDISFIEIPVYTNREIAYVPIEPAFTNFIRPTNIIVGFDELIYIVDVATEEIICYDEAAKEQGRYKVPGLTFVTQDRKLDLLAIGTFDTIINGSPYSLTTIYRINQTSPTGYGLNHAQVVNKIVHPFYFKSSFSLSDADVKFGNIAVMGDLINPLRNNQYYATREGTNSNNANQGPDDAVLLFTNKDVYVSPVPITTSGGLFNNYFKDPHGLTGWAKPPQINASTSPDFIYTSLDPGNLLKVQYIEFIEAEFGAEYRPVIFPVNDPLATGYLNTPGKFEKPMGITVSGDDSRYIFVTDAEKDSVYQFTSNGLEGIPPPPGSEEKVYRKASFGGRGTGPMQFNEPMGVAYFNKILYVADAGNGRILRFKLTLDFE